MSSASHGEHSHGEHDDGAVHAHVSSVQFMAGIFAALICLTVVTVAVSRIDLGSMNSVVAIAVATVKAALVAAFFMHLRYEKPLNTFIFVMAFVFLGVFIGLTMNDIGMRGAVDRENGTRLRERQGEVAPGGLQVPRAPAAAPAEHGAAAAPSAAPAAEHH